MSRRAALIFVSLGVAWGIPYVLIKIAVEDLNPAALVLARTGLAALLLLPIALARHQVRPVLRRWRPLVAYTILEIAIPWFFLNKAETVLPSSTTGLLLATVPLAGLIVAVLFGRAEQMSLTNWLGVVVAMCGVAALVGFDVAGSDLFAVGEVLIVVIGYALGPAILVRWMRDLPGLGVVACSVGLAAAAYVPIVALSGSWPTSAPGTDTIVSVVVLSVICTVLAFLLLFALVGEIGPVKATTITYLNPAVAVIAGAVVLSEPVTIWTVVGFVLVLSGSVLVTWRQRPPAAATAEPSVIPAYGRLPSG